jgi:hypothetical protein
MVFKYGDKWSCEIAHEHIKSYYCIDEDNAF